MRWVYYYLALLSLLVACTSYGIVHPAAHVELLKGLLAGVPILSALAQALSKANLPFYLFTQRLWLKFHSSTPSVWRFGMRFSKSPAPGAFEALLNTFEHRLSGWNPKVIYKAEHEFRVIIDRTIHFRVSYDCGAYSEDGEDHFLVQSDPLEVTYGQAESKLERSIRPILRSVMREMNVASSSSFMDIDFVDRNPFFAFFVAHIDERHVSSFNLVFRPPSLSEERSEKVIVTKKTMQVNATTPEDFTRLSKEFLLLSASASQYARN